jgi:hypothetical protein
MFSVRIYLPWSSIQFTCLNRRKQTFSGHKYTYLHFNIPATCFDKYLEAVNAKSVHFYSDNFVTKTPQKIVYTRIYHMEHVCNDVGSYLRELEL